MIAKSEIGSRQLSLIGVHLVLNGTDVVVNKATSVHGLIQTDCGLGVMV